MRTPGKKKSKKKAAAEEGGADGMDADQPEQPVAPSVWQPGADAVNEGETLQYDPTAYDCLHQLTFEWPSLSFDIVKDQLGGPRRAFPHSMMLVTGTQAATARANYLALMRLSNLGQGEHAKKAEDSDSDMDDSDSESEDEGEKARLHTVKVPTVCGLNRVRAMPQRPGVVAAWGEDGRVQVWDLVQQLQQLAAIPEDSADNQQRVHAKAVHSHQHKDEGFALDWSRVAAGRLAAGDCAKVIHVWEPRDGGFAVSAPYREHTASVEDIQWSPTEATVFASASVDRTIRIWDTRDRSKAQITVAAHQADVNVIAWNVLTPHTLASGGDEGRLRVWDLRAFEQPVADFNHHRGPVTSVEWSPHEAAMLATTSADNSLGIWDLALERDPEEEVALGLAENALAPADLPAQLLFVHAGQTDVKEAHWHAQIPGMLASTAADGLHVFKPYNILDDFTGK